jgi:NAD(P)-dependent dehydrogenase (short-subunit alcohol dehydrogenase family)
MVKKVAFITGGASGIGLAVAQSLASGSRSEEDWDVHLIDLNADALKRATSLVKNAHSHQTDVTDFTSLASAFESAWSLSGGRLDFVFANAGIIERDSA